MSARYINKVDVNFLFCFFFLIFHSKLRFKCKYFVKVGGGGGYKDDFAKFDNLVL